MFDIETTSRLFRPTAAVANRQDHASRSRSEAVTAALESKAAKETPASRSSLSDSKASPSVPATIETGSSLFRPTAAVANRQDHASRSRSEAVTAALDSKAAKETPASRSSLSDTKPAPSVPAAIETGSSLFRPTAAVANRKDRTPKGRASASVFRSGVKSGLSPGSVHAIINQTNMTKVPGVELISESKLSTSSGNTTSGYSLRQRNRGEPFSWSNVFAKILTPSVSSRERRGTSRSSSSTSSRPHSQFQLPDDDDENVAKGSRGSGAFRRNEVRGSANALQYCE